MIEKVEKEVFDWEDKVYESLQGKTYQMKVTGTGLDTRYKYKLTGSAPENTQAKQEATEDISDMGW